MTSATFQRLKYPALALAALVLLGGAFALWWSSARPIAVPARPASRLGLAPDPVVDLDRLDEGAAQLSPGVQRWPY